MTWTTPRTWLTGEILTASDMNTHLRDNLDALKDPPTEHYELNEVSNYSTTSTTFVDVDATNLALTIETTGGDVLVGFAAGMRLSTNATYVYFDIDIDGVRHGGDDGMILTRSNLPSGGADIPAVSFTRLLTGLSAGSHTFTLQWKVNANSVEMYAGAGTTSADIHPQFWVREVS